MDKKTLEWYNRNAKTYYHPDITYPEDVKELALFLGTQPKEGKVLDAGCGSGNFTKAIAESGLDPIGIDLSAELIALCKNANPNINFKVADMRNLPFGDNYFNGIWAHASLVHMKTKEDVHKSFKEFARVLKDNGKIHVTVKKKEKKQTEYAIEPKTGELRYFRYFSKEEIVGIIESAGFATDSVDVYNEFARNGTGRKNTNWIYVLAHKI